MWSRFSHFAHVYGYGSMVLFACVVLIAASLTSALTKHTPPSVNSPTGIQDVRQYWDAEIDRLGGAEAYAEFKTFYTAAPINAHLAAHIMGSLLYENLALSGLTVCDDSFSNGCYHAFLAKALVDRGPDAMKEIAAACDSVAPEKRYSCAHGVGHGVLEYYGTDRLLKALEVCGSLFERTEVSGCAGGVFMDFNAPVVTEGSAPEITKRPFDVHRPYEPCDMRGVPSSMRDDCYATLAPYWWDSVGGIQGVDALCAKAPQVFQKACYSGIGFQLPGDVMYDQGAIIEACKSLGRTDRTEWCLSRSAAIQKQFGFETCAIDQKLAYPKTLDCLQ